MNSKPDKENRSCDDIAFLSEIIANSRYWQVSFLFINQRYEPQSKLWTQKEASFARTFYPAAELQGIL